MQQVNLYVVELRPKKDWFSAKYLSAIFLGAFVVLLLLNFVKGREVSRMQQDLEEKQLVLRALELELDKTKTSTRPSSRQEIEGQIALLQRKIDSRERLTTLIQGQTLDENFSFNSAMRAMAVNASSRVSVSQFTFSRGGKTIEMQGEGTRSYDVPEYLNRLRKEDVFKRSKFGLITIGNIKPSGNVEFSVGYGAASAYGKRGEQ